MCVRTRAYAYTKLHVNVHVHVYIAIVQVATIETTHPIARPNCKIYNYIYNFNMIN